MLIESENGSTNLVGVALSINACDHLVSYTANMAPNLPRCVGFGSLGKVDASR